MKPVNLLPPSARPYQATGKSGAAYVVVGVLAALVIGVLAYVVTVNQITSRNDEIQRAQQETQAAQARSAGLQKYASFTQVASARMQAVASRAMGRIDYERVLRETSRILPSGVWLTSLDAESNDGAGSSGSSSTSSSGGTPTGPTVHFTGCAPSQRSVAATMVRLRAVHGSDDVQLNESGTPLKLGASAAGGSGGGSSDCGDNYAFDILVTLNGDITGYGDQGRKVPVSLGGGS